ncbi:MAG: hypothetical protein ACRC20_01645 [Segniliparus sp.]|uniref:hypothetical protein n=1 Tax=Segniliparus sp. TaxID=2804064 RepID=UPI003F2A8A01
MSQEGGALRRMAAAAVVAILANGLAASIAQADPLPCCPPVDMSGAHRPELVASDRVPPAEWTKRPQSGQSRLNDPVSW